MAAYNSFLSVVAQTNNMHRIKTIYIVFLLIGLIPIMAEPLDTEVSLKSLSVSQLEKQLSTIDAEIKQLPHYSLRSGIGPVGYRSMDHSESSKPEWIQIELGEEMPIDEIVLVPSIWRDTESGFRADGFPLEFRIVAGKSDETNGVVIAAFTEDDNLLPRIAPLVVPCPELPLPG